MPQMQQAELAARANNRKIRTGIVTSNRMMKTIVVQVTQLVRHQKYNRVMRQQSSFKVHDETNSAAVGDWVRIIETRPLSKEKCWRLLEITRRASSAPPLPEDDVTQSQKPSLDAPPAADRSGRPRTKSPQPIASVRVEGSKEERAPQGGAEEGLRAG